MWGLETYNPNSETSNWNSRNCTRIMNSPTPKHNLSPQKLEYFLRQSALPNLNQHPLQNTNRPSSGPHTSLLFNLTTTLNFVRISYFKTLPAQTWPENLGSGLDITNISFVQAAPKWGTQITRKQSSNLFESTQRQHARRPHPPCKLRAAQNAFKVS